MISAWFSHKHSNVQTSNFRVFYIYDIITWYFIIIAYGYDIITYYFNSDKTATSKPVSWRSPMAAFCKCTFHNTLNSLVTWRNQVQRFGTPFQIQRAPIATLSIFKSTNNGPVWGERRARRLANCVRVGSSMCDPNSSDKIGFVPRIL